MAFKLDVSKLPWHAQLGIFATLAIAGVSVFGCFYAAPTTTGLETRRAQLRALLKEIDQGYATAKRLPEYRREVAVLETQLDRLRPVLPGEQDVADLLRRVQAMATQSNLTIRGFSPEPVTRREMHAEWPIGLKLEGRYHDLGAFLERLRTFPRIINVGALHITARTESSPIATVIAECRAMTFVLVEDAAPEGKAKGKRARDTVARAVAPAVAPGTATAAENARQATALPAEGAPSDEMPVPLALQARGFTSDAEGRRDPFVSLMRRGPGGGPSSHNGPRPAGLKGLATGEVLLKGTMASQGTILGILQGADARTYVVHGGERLYDGTIRSITADALVIVQHADDPLSREPRREVRKVLRQTEEAR